VPSPKNPALSSTRSLGPRCPSRRQSRTGSCAAARRGGTGFEGSPAWPYPNGLSRCLPVTSLSPCLSRSRPVTVAEGSPCVAISKPGRDRDRLACTVRRGVDSGPLGRDPRAPPLTLRRRQAECVLQAEYAPSGSVRLSAYFRRSMQAGSTPSPSHGHGARPSLVPATSHFYAPWPEAGRPG
jgi:hypothetical protein